MATAAELRARLAKYLPKQETQDVISKQAAPGVASEVAPESTIVQRDVGKDSVVAGEVSKLLPAVVETVVQTDLQPTTLVVVERPAPASESRTLESDTSIIGAGNEMGSDGVSTTNLDTTNPVHAGFLQRLDDLEASLLARDPLMRTHLGHIHKTMIEYEEIANLLTEDEIRKIMTAQQAHTGIILKQELVKESKSKATAKAAKIGLGDI